MGNTKFTTKVVSYDVPRFAGYVVRARCSYCSAPEGVVCQTRSGKALVGPSKIHQARFKDAAHVMSNRISALRMKNDDPRFGLKAGDILAGHLYALDPSKWSILGRVNDGYDPECNQYSTSVEWIGWATARLHP